MKKLNLIGWLSRNSHEKQSPQRFVRYAAMLIMLLTLGVGHALAYDYTVYCVPEYLWGNDWSDSGTDWVRVQYGKNMSDGEGYASMSKTELRYSGYDIYKATIACKYEGADWINFQRMTGNSETVEHTYACIKSWWGQDGFNGKLYKAEWSGGTPVWSSLSYDTYDVTATADVYFDNTETNWSNVSIHLIQSGGTYDYAFTQITGTPYWKYSFTSNWNDYGAAIFFQSGWGHQSGRLYANIGSGTTLFTPNSGSDYAGFSTTAPVGPKNISISNTASIVRGEGTEGNPYIVAPGASITQSVSAETIDGSTTLNYKFSAGSASSYSSSTTTNTRIASAVAGTSYNVYATVKTMKSSNSSREFNTNTLYYTTAYTITLNDNGGSGGDGASYAVNGKAAINPTSIPSLSGKGFDGYWTGAGGTGTQVINEKGQWNTGIAGYTDNDGNWICTSNSTLYARWLDPGYYMVGGFNNWKATTKMSGSGPYTWDTESLDPGDYTSNKTGFKIRKVVEGSGTLDVWYGGSSEGIELGKESTSSTSIASPGNNFILQVYYDGVYSFTWTANSKIQVAVPVVDQLRIYKDNDASVSIYTDWVDPSAATVTATVALERGHTYQFKPVLESVYYGKGSGSTYTTLTRDSYSVTVGTGNTNANNVKLSADLKGNYTFNFTSSTNSLSVTYPTRRQINYSVVTKRSGNGTASGANGSLSAENDSDGDFAVSSGGYVVDGNSVTFRAPAAKSGYTWRGWFSKNNPSDWDDGKVSTSTNDYYTTTVTGGNTTVYAIYSENTYTVAVDSTSNYTASGNYGGCVKVSGTKVGSVSNVGVNSYAELTAVPTNLAWRFKQWDIPSGVTLKSGTTTSATIQINATAGSLTVTAIFEPKFGLFGSYKDNDTPGGMPGWSTADDFAVTSFTDKNTMSLNSTRTLEPNTEYRFQVYDREYSVYRSGDKDWEMLANESWELTSSTKQIYYKTAGYGDYRFEITKINDSNQPSIHIIRPTSYGITIGTLTSFNEGARSTSDGTGGSVSCKTTEENPDSGDDTDYPISSGDSIRSGGTAVFTATAEDGYTFAGWYQNSDCSTEYTEVSGVSISDNVLTLSGIGADKAVYAKFTENMTTVVINANFESRGTITVAGDAFDWGSTTTVGVETTRALVATPEDGYYFSGWTRTEGTDYTLGGYAEANYSTTMTGAGDGETSGQVLTANFLPLEKMYFRNWNESLNSALWTDVWVYYDVSFVDNCAKSNSNAGFIKQMRQIEGTNVYWAYVPRDVTSRNCAHIAFSNHQFTPDYKFLNYEGIKWANVDWKLNMFVPQASDNSTVNSTKYYAGYWKSYAKPSGAEAGYYMKRRTAASTYADAATDNKFVVVDENTVSYRLRIDNLTEGNNYYMIHSAGGIKYITEQTPTAVYNGKTVTSGDCSNIDILKWDGSDAYFYITPTAEGDYVITIDQSSDKMNISVNYPVAINDYRLHHTYTISATTHDTYSDVIKNGSTTTKVSMFINTANTPTMALERCTAISNKGVPTWTDQSAGMSISTASGNFDDGNGVYEFDFALSTHAMSNIKLYEGDYYIKTDCAPGMWAAYKSNLMARNTINYSKSDSKTFDYYFCHWVGDEYGDTNVKCVIANDYNNQITDTLKGDAVIGMENQTIRNANIRFSYNSYTNELKRTYLNGSGNYHNKFLYLEGNDKVDVRNDGKNLKHDTIMTDNNNWTYILDVKVKPGARARLTGKYGDVSTGAVQDFIGQWNSGAAISDENTKELIGGSADVWFNVRMVYDFKTNHLMTGWLAPESGNTASTALNADVIILREAQEDANQIKFANKGDALSNVQTVYGVMKFNKWTINNRAKTGEHATLSLSQYERDLFWISFPFDVNLNEVFGFGTYGTHWIIEYYDGKGRAKNGFWVDSEPNWKFVTPYMRANGGEDGNGYILNANEGYILALDLDKLGLSSTVWENNVEDVFLYFPSESAVTSIEPADSKDVTIDQDGYKCTINRGTTDGDRRIKDSYWHCIGAPSYANVNHSVTNADPTATSLGAEELWTPTGLLYFYNWNKTTNELSVEKTSGSKAFSAMHSYMVQYSGTTLTWANVNKPAASVAARLTDTPNRDYKLAILCDDAEADHTFVHFTDNAGVTAAFEFNQDLSKEMNRNRGNIWTVTTDGTQVAGNSMPHPLATTIVPVGVKIATAGEYTFTMPEGTNGGDVWLLDNQTGSRTNLGLMDYTVNLTAGTIDGRFSLEFPVQNVVTDMETVDNGQLTVDNDARKVFVGGRLYIIRDGKAYDATGAQVR